MIQKKICYGIYKDKKYEHHRIIFKIEGQKNWVLRDCTQNTVDRETIYHKYYYYTDDGKGFDEFHPFHRMGDERGVNYLVVPDDIQEMCEKYMDEFRCHKLFRPERSPYVKGNIDTKCEIEFIRLLGIFHNDEYQKDKDCHRMILVKFGLKNGKTIVVNRRSIMVNYNVEHDDFFYSERENMNDVPRYNKISFSSNWKTKDEFDSEYCDYLNYLHCGLELVKDYDYYLGKNWNYNNEKNSDLPRIDTILENIDEEMSKR